MSSETVIYTAGKIITVNRYLPEATAVAVRDGCILCVGTLEECLMWQSAGSDPVIDDTFRDHVLIPGFIEAHGHTAQGSMIKLPYVGYFDQPMPDGSIARGIRSYDAMIDRLRELDAELPEGEPLYVQGFDPIYFINEPRLDKTHLDQVSTTREIVIRHASGHLLTVNSAVLKSEGITGETTTPGVPMGEDGEPNGELQEPPAMALVRRFTQTMMPMVVGTDVVRAYGELCRNAGVTTSTELVGMMLVMADANKAWATVIEDPSFPARIVNYNLPSLPGLTINYDEVAAAAAVLREANSDKYMNQGVKLLLDGSIQGWTALMQWPGYMTGTDHGLPLYSTEDLNALVLALHKARLNIHAHCNGNGAGQQFIEAVENAVIRYPWLDHRHTLTHSQTTTAAQYRKMARLGICANIFTNHIYYWGDQHYEQTLGPEQTRRMWACRTAAREGVSYSFHSDAGVTPVGHLMTMWCAVNRLTASGRVLGEEERITPYEALEAATISAAYQLHLDHEIGSIEAGKLADFAVLEASPLEVDPLAIKDIGIWGTVVGGVKYPAPR